MTKLNRVEIQELCEVEGSYRDIDVPADAHSVFRFEIKENFADIRNNIVKDSTEHNNKDAKWYLFEDEDGKSRLRDLDFYSQAEIEMQDDTMIIETAWGGYIYRIKENGKGCSVQFEGPLNALKNQYLLPDMTYIPSTLEGKFVDPEGHKDITDFMDMNNYSILRSKKNAKNNTKNSQDSYGYNINRMFNNEIPGLPKAYVTEQEREEIEKQEKIANIQKHIEDMKGKKSGVVKADEMAMLAMKNKTR